MQPRCLVLVLRGPASDQLDDRQAFCDPTKAQSMARHPNKLGNADSLCYMSGGLKATVTWFREWPKALACRHQTALHYDLGNRLFSLDSKISAVCIYGAIRFLSALEKKRDICLLFLEYIRALSCRTAYQAYLTSSSIVVSQNIQKRAICCDAIPKRFFVYLMSFLICLSTADIESRRRGVADALIFPSFR
jgi:hypothetical protein